MKNKRHEPKLAGKIDKLIESKREQRKKRPRSERYLADRLRASAQLEKILVLRTRKAEDELERVGGGPK